MMKSVQENSKRTFIKKPVRSSKIFYISCKQEVLFCNFSKEMKKRLGRKRV